MNSWKAARMGGWDRLKMLANEQRRQMQSDGLVWEMGESSFSTTHRRFGCLSRDRDTFHLFPGRAEHGRGW